MGNESDQNDLLESSSGATDSMEDLRRALDHEKKLRMSGQGTLSAQAGNADSLDAIESGKSRLSLKIRSGDRAREWLASEDPSSPEEPASGMESELPNSSVKTPLWTRIVEHRLFKNGLPANFGSGGERRCGLECGSSGAKLVHLSFKGGEALVEDVMLEDEPFESRISNTARTSVEIVRKMLIQRNMSGCKTVFVNDEASGCCFIMMPRMSKEDADGAVLLQSKKTLSLNSAEPVMARMDSDYLRDRTGSVVGLADWSGMKSWCKIVETSGGIVDDVTIRACAYKALAEQQGWRDEHAVILVADFGAAMSRFFIVDAEAVRFMREIPTGGDAITKALTTEVSTENGKIRLGSVEAEAFKIRGDLAKVDMVIRPVIERMTSDVLRSIQFFEENSGQKVSAIYVTGGSSNLSMLNKHLASSISIPIKNLNPFANLRFSSTRVRALADKHMARLTVAVGLALAKKNGVSLLPRPVQRAKSLARLAPLVAAALIILGFLPVMAVGVSQVVRSQRIRQRIAAYEKELSGPDERVGQLAALQAREGEASELNRAIQSLMIDQPLWAGVLNALAYAVSENLVLQSFEVDLSKGRTMLLRGYVGASAGNFDNAVSSFLSALNKSVFFSQVRLTNAKSQRQGRKSGTFVIECEMVY